MVCLRGSESERVYLIVAEIERGRAKKREVVCQDE